ncbi:MAG: hypothetical protein A2122_00145 [Candidatus Liptonbacteria bacterium GWB1_49_6]|uniref:Type II secretion system protein GspG C-terminal domain-containing protein n=1 Tax=Candidatus Liptonbacteria bacterium GWB1_49_6 TaxID=1798644 RepID=A0A1G2C443_9BACT|nr:MAG: hypothetical protein A2122_00145 [Candidatus Liptonbacteria bacterium GWB1_49_6]
MIYKVKQWMRTRGFSLIELLVAVGVLAVIGVVTVITLNPAELFKESRDTSRFSSLATLRKAITLFQANNSDPSAMGDQHVVYVSLPDEDPNCGSWGLGSFVDENGNTWQHQCAPSADLTRANGSGWIPINFESEGKSLLPALPIDPVNQLDGSYFYTYARDEAGHYEINTRTESVKYSGGN